MDNKHYTRNIGKKQDSIGHGKRFLNLLENVQFECLIYYQ